MIMRIPGGMIVRMRTMRDSWTAGFVNCWLTSVNCQLKKEGLTSIRESKRSTHLGDRWMYVEVRPIDLDFDASMSKFDPSISDFDASMSRFHPSISISMHPCRG